MGAERILQPADQAHVFFNHLFCIFRRFIFLILGIMFLGLECVIEVILIREEDLNVTNIYLIGLIIIIRVF